MSIKHKSKPCNGIGKAKEFEGCKGLTLVRTYGLCSPCFHRWVRETEEGKEQAAKLAIKKVKEIRTEKTKDIKQKKDKLLSADAYRKKYVQPLFNKIIRMIDHDQPCIATGAITGQKHAGHYFSVGSNRTLCVNAHNVFIQSMHSNSWKGGDDKNYRIGLKETFGSDYLEFVEGLPKHRPIKLNKDAYVKLKKALQEYKKTLSLEVRTANERIELRNELNEYLNIYDSEYKTYKC